MKHLLGNKKLLVLSNQMVFSGGSFLITLLLARLLKDDFGLYASIVLSIYLFVSLCNALIIQPLQVTLATVDNVEAYTAFSFWGQITLIAIINLSSFIALSIDWPKLADYQALKYGLIALSTGFLLHDFFRKLLLAQAKVLEALILDITMVSGQLIALFVLWLNDIKSPNLVLICLAWSYLPSALYGIWLTKPKLKYLRESALYLHTHYTQGRWLVLTALVQWWSSNLFVVASGVFIGKQALGAFRLAQSLFGVINIILQTFENYALPEAARLYAHSTQSAATYIKHISRRVLPLFGAILLGLFLFSDQVIFLAGGETFKDYGFVIKGMSILYIFIFIGIPIRMAMRVKILNSHFFLGYLFSLVFSLISFNYLLSKWELNGAIIGLAISQIIVLAYYQVILIKKDFQLWK